MKFSLGTPTRDDRFSLRVPVKVELWSLKSLRHSTIVLIVLVSLNSCAGELDNFRGFLTGNI